MSEKELNTNEDFVDYWKKFNTDGYQKNISKKKLLRKNSKELVRVCNDFEILKDEIDIFEIGCGCARNLYYMWNSNKNINIHGNDLIREECFKYMKEEIKPIIDFKEIDTFRLIDQNNISIDLFISSDHLMHLEPNTSKLVLESIVHKWKPGYILLRESLVDRLNKGVKKFKIDYSIIKEKYDILYEEKSINDSSYIIVLGKIKND
jgi:hypothetical protein